jgi:flagellar basal body-associated protein FliL
MKEKGKRVGDSLFFKIIFLFLGNFVIISLVVGMEKEILVILMAAFGIFAIVMFVLFFVYLKKYYNDKHLEDDYQKEIDQKPIDEDDIVVKEVEVPKKDVEDMEFIPIKKK